MSKKICPLVYKSTIFLNFSSEKIPIPMNAFRYNTNNCLHYHVLMFFTHTVFRELELTLMLQKPNRFFFSSKSRGIRLKQNYFFQPNASQTIGVWYFFGKNHVLYVPVQLNVPQTMPKSNEFYFV
jgi:hypothetical protein